MPLASCPASFRGSTMPDLRPPHVPSTPEFRKRVEAMLRRAVRGETRVPRMPRFGYRWSTAPAGTAVMAMLAVAFVLNVSVVQAPPGTSLPHWTAPQTTLVEATTAPAVDDGTIDRHHRVPEVERALIDGRFEREALRSPNPIAEPPPSTIPQ